MFYPGDFYMLERSILWFPKPDWAEWKMSEFWWRTLSSSPSVWAVTYSLESHWPADVQWRNKHNSVLPTLPASCSGVFSLHVTIFWALPLQGVNEVGRTRQWVINYLWGGEWWCQQCHQWTGRYCLQGHEVYQWTAIELHEHIMSTWTLGQIISSQEKWMK